MNMARRISVSTDQMSRQEVLAAFHIERSRCIDAFAAIEEAVVGIAVLHDLKVGTESFGQRLETLRKIRPSPKFSKARAKALEELLPVCIELNQIRNEIVHSKLQLAELAGSYRACFTNTKQCLEESQAARLFTLEGLQALSVRFSRLAVELNQVLINPASSPPPPLPGAAGDP